MGSPLRGRGQIVLDRTRRFQYLHLGQVRWSVPGWTSRLCLRVSAYHVTQGVLPGVPQCVPYRWVTLSSLQGSSWSLVGGLGWSFVPYPLFCRLGLVPRSVAQLCALLPLVPSFRVCFSHPLCTPGRRSASRFT